MDLTSPLKPDVFRVVVVILLPGLLATFPWLGWFYWPELLQTGFWKTNGWVAAGSIFAIVMLAGMVLEDIGASLEARQIDQHVCKEKSIDQADFDNQWRSYLLSKADDRFVAHRYLRSMVTRFKFELSMLPACASVAIAIILAWAKDVGFDTQRTLGFLVFDLALIYYLYDQAKRGAWQLHEIRQWICEAEAKGK